MKARAEQHGEEGRNAGGKKSAGRKFENQPCNAVP